jgi:hypothetical protein
MGGPPDWGVKETAEAVIASSVRTKMAEKDSLAAFRFGCAARIACKRVSTVAAARHRNRSRRPSPVATKILRDIQ